ncbi:hypothetical protein N7454_007757 [Penicillium verhagenii]|nr:hypothetical protein N7454_007757 [Penicillium verhagenii]
MSPPEMSYSPAYHQAQGPAASITTPSPLIRSAPEQPKPIPSSPLRSSDWMAHDVSPRNSIPRGSHSHSPETSRRASKVGEEGVKPVTVTNGSNKEARSPGSWQPSLMSGENTRCASYAVPTLRPGSTLLLCRLHIYFFAIIFAILISPLRLCSLSPYLRKTSFRTQLCDLLSPVLHIHERLVFMPPPTSTRSSSTQWIHSDPDSEEPIPVVDSSILYSVGMSIVVLTLSPFFSIAILLFAWTAAAFWVFAMVMGNPDGTERNDDGRAAVLGVCKWWRTWLGKSRPSP